MAILLARHGETAYNAARVIQLPETPLNERGLAQARRLASRLAGIGVAAILSSDYARARMTAEAVREATGAPLRETPTLRERNLGEHRGLAYDALGFDVFAPDHRPPGGETWEAFFARVERAWEEIQAHAGGVEGNLAVVSHALVVRRIAEHHVPLAPGLRADRVRWGNTALTVVEGEPGAWRITRLACTDHLDDPGVADANHPAGI